jgi:hypothetical protein
MKTDQIMEYVCDNLCKYPAEYKDPDDLWNEQCDHCKLIELLDVNHIPYTAADVEEKRTGKWIKVSYVERSAFGRAIWHKTFQCSRCGGLFGREGDKYCYNCGADMREES